MAAGRALPSSSSPRSGHPMSAIVKLDTIEDLPPADGDPPFKGLAYFSEADADIFFGREELSDKLVARLQTSGALAVIGASGSGKSSLLRAGVVPRLRAQNWLIRILTPAAHPLERLANTLTLDDDSLNAAGEMQAALAEKVLISILSSPECEEIIRSEACLTDTPPKIE